MARRKGGTQQGGLTVHDALHVANPPLEPACGGHRKVVWRRTAGRGVIPVVGGGRGEGAVQYTGTRAVLGRHEPFESFGGGGVFWGGGMFAVMAVVARLEAIRTTHGVSALSNVMIQSEAVEAALVVFIEQEVLPVWQRSNGRRRVGRAEQGMQIAHLLRRAQIRPDVERRGYPIGLCAWGSRSTLSHPRGVVDGQGCGRGTGMARRVVVLCYRGGSRGG